MSLDRMIVRCLYDEKECDLKKDFKITESALFGKCFSFNSVGSDLKLRRTGFYSGLRLELFIGEEEYQPCWAYLRGLIVVINNKNQIKLVLWRSLCAVYVHWH